MSDKPSEAKGPMPFGQALLEVVKNLREDKFLTYGLGAGIVLVGALTVTSSTQQVLIVAGVLLVVYLGRIFGHVQKLRGGGALSKVFLVGTRIDHSRVGKASATGSSQATSRVTGLFSTIRDSDVGNVSSGDGPDSRDL
jgi:hypothetical protein